MGLTIQNVSKKFNQNVILENVNLNFEKGKIYGIIGRNGSGKSVLLKMICGLYKPSSGKILVNNEDITVTGIFPHNVRALIEKASFLPDMTGFENLKLLASIQNKIGDKEIKESLKKVNLIDEMNKKYYQYSLGMQQKLGIAQVLMENPDILILDEPFNGLEEETINKVRKILLEEKKKGKTILLATHIKDDVAILCDEVYKVDGGRVIQIKNISIEK